MALNLQSHSVNPTKKRLLSLILVQDPYIWAHVQEFCASLGEALENASVVRRAE
jgi:hypothetical protein